MDEGAGSEVVARTMTSHDGRDLRGDGARAGGVPSPARSLRVDVVGWAGNATTARLLTELLGRGHRAACVDPERMAVDLGREVTVVPYDARPTPDVVVTAVSTEALVALEGVGALGRAGVAVVNEPSAVLAAADKFVTARALRVSGVAHPRTVQVSTAPAALAVAVRLGWPVVVKAPDGSEGSRVFLAGDEGALVAALDAVRWREGRDLAANTPVLVQELVDAPLGRDRRIVVCGGVAVAAIERVGRDGEWRSNLSQGAEPRAVVVTRAEEAAALAAVRSLGLDLGTVDVLPTPVGPVVLEVNSFGDLVDVAAFSGVDVVGAVADLAEAVAAGRRCLTASSARSLLPGARAAELSFCNDRLARKAVELAARRVPAAGRAAHRSP